MAILLKNNNKQIAAGTGPNGQSVINQFIHVARPTLALPQSTTEILFRVYGGRIHVKLLIGEVTTVIQSSDPVAKITSGRLDDASALVGTVYDIASTLNMSSDEVGTIYTVEGDGTAIVSPQLAGAGYFGAVAGFVQPQGEIYLTTGASKTGAIKWDLWYQPLDEGAYAVAIPTATAAI